MDQTRPKCLDRRLRIVSNGNAEKVRLLFCQFDLHCLSLPKGTVPAYKEGQKVILRAATWTIVKTWSERHWNKAGTKLTKVPWVRLRRDQDFYEEARPVRGKPVLERKAK